MLEKEMAYGLSVCQVGTEKSIRDRPSVTNATEIADRVVRQKRNEDKVLSEVRNESEMFWGTWEWAIFKSAVEERHARPVSVYYTQLTLPTS